jgi:Protein of unknown function (DUF3515)
VLTAVLVPLIAAAVVLTRVVGHGSGSVADVSAPPSPQRDQLPVVPVAVPPVTPQAQASCPALMEKLPLELAGRPSRRVRSESPFAYAWGDPAAVLVCGVDRPAGFGPTAGLIQINGVQWYVDTSSAEHVVWTAVDRPVYVQVTVSADTDSAPVTALSDVIATALPQQPPQPGP